MLLIMLQTPNSLYVFDELGLVSYSPMGKEDCWTRNFPVQKEFESVWYRLIILLEYKVYPDLMNNGLYYKLLPDSNKGTILQLKIVQLTQATRLDIPGRNTTSYGSSHCRKFFTLIRKFCK